MKKLLILLWSDKANVRNFLFGFCQSARHHKAWSLDIRSSSDLDNPVIAQRIRDGFYDGIITDEGVFLAHTWLADIVKPALVLYATYNPVQRKAGDNLIYVQHNNGITGRHIANYLMGLGTFSSYAYVPIFPSEPWSVARGRGFQEAIEERHQNFCLHDESIPLAQFLRSLPKPAAVMAACDRVALNVTDACRSSGLAVPGKVAVISVDNDETICEFSRPSLTSVIHDPQSELGRKAGEAMHSLLNGWRSKKPGCVEYNNIKVIERESCAHLPQSTYLAHSAMHFIEKNAQRALKVGDVVAHLGVSRRLADQQFKLVHGETMLTAITRLRLVEVEKRLLLSRLPITKIANLCGFDDLAYLGKLFRRRYGVSMREYRKEKNTKTTLRLST